MTCTLPLSPPPQSCHDKLIELFSEKLYLIGLAALVVAVIMVSVRLDVSHSGVKRFTTWPEAPAFISCDTDAGACPIKPSLFLFPPHVDLRDDLHNGALLWDP